MKKHSVVRSIGLVSLGIVTIVPLGFLPACDAQFDCSQRDCSDYGASSKSFQSCCACGSDYGATIQLRDSAGKVLYECSDDDGKTCSTGSGYIDAIESYCGI